MHRNKSHHWFNLLIIFSMVSSAHLQNDAPICFLSKYPVSYYLSSDREAEDTKKDITILFSSVLCEHL